MSNRRSIVRLFAGRAAAVAIVGQYRLQCPYRSILTKVNMRPFVTLLTCMLLFGCSSSSGTSVDPLPVTLRTEDPRISAQDSTAILSLVVSNTGDSAVSFQTGAPEFAFHAVVSTLAGGVIWDRLQGVVLQEPSHSVTVPAGDVVRFSASWDLRTNNGEVVSPGDYHLSGGVFGLPASLRAEPIVFSVPVRP